MMKKISALVLVVMMMMTVTAFGAELGANNEEGVVGQFNTGVGVDNPTPTAKNINIKKKIIAFNSNGTTVHAPVITYTYTVTPASVNNMTITDEAADHESAEAVVAPVKAGITTGLVVTGANATGTAVTGSAGTAASASATLVFDNTSTWNTAASGETNEYDINLDFANVTFAQPGVYRYQIAETISATSYEAVAMEDGDYNTVYLDVYVDGTGNIYGYVCLTENASVTPDTNTKINGFVDGTAADGSDKYYTYDLVLSKDVVNDNYAATNTAFPFTVIFNNTENYTSTFSIDQTVGTGSTGLNNSAATLTGLPNVWNGVALVKDGDAATGTTVGDITLTGIPAGVDVDVYETNIVTGVTYAVSSKVNGNEASSDASVNWGTAPNNAVAQGDSKTNTWESTKVTVNTPKISTVNVGQTVAITNTLLLISPTGVVLRVAPYVLMLAAGIVLVVLAMKRRKAHVEEE